MSVTFRELSPAEIEQLPADFYKDVDRMNLGGRYSPDMLGAVVGAFEGSELVGAWVATVLVHTGPIWVAQKHRGSSGSIRTGLWDRVKYVVRSLGAKRAFIAVLDDAPQVAHMVSKLPGTYVPGRFFLAEV